MRNRIALGLWSLAILGALGLIALYADALGMWIVGIAVAVALTTIGRKADEKK